MVLRNLFSENKGADQLRGYREADLRLCHRIYAKKKKKNKFSHDAAHFVIRDKIVNISLS